VASSASFFAFLVFVVALDSHYIERNVPLTDFTGKRTKKNNMIFSFFFFVISVGFLPIYLIPQFFLIEGSSQPEKNLNILLFFSI